MRAVLLVLLGAGYALALSQGHLGLASLPAFALLLCSGWLVQPARARHWNILGHLLFILTGAALALHGLPGFDNAWVIDQARFSADAIPFSMHLNLDKPMIGFWLLLACPWIVMTRRPRPGLAALAVLLTSLACLGSAWLLGLVGWQPKWPPQAWLWITNNLLLVSLVEEALFRGYLQGGLQRLFVRLRHGDYLALLLAALLFGLAHVGGGWPWVALATLAGVGYGLAWRHGGLPAALLAHFGLNLAHFVLFTYPLKAIP
ncbi:CPBP family intramembrane glutamic endopeptidase [Pseudomonas sp. 148P]|uniref:CPBP family intramembrane glutamic endopeptidase n=1 Tax=Pseudomonas ulcerans TaxID=3115852 RepID=A0ABU7HQG8_9PSED|nr:MULTISPECIES: CPBP family intramembrane glutamic endopeptidase [unclassified Pseudomonas]MEE1923709.1 CPBP family intramembrane glutamic endopeptidase [Pseudomonas sp. 147P]MEE1933769.1 CPBP family intramembrane glutamic endopeptidase [Pseudomonas sp. 148P]